jgi:hypothetical protein
MPRISAAKSQKRWRHEENSDQGPKETLSGTPNRAFKESYMGEKSIKPKISFPSQLLKKVDRLTRKACIYRSKYACAVIEARMFADEMKAAYGESK